MKRYAIRADITFIVSAEDLESALAMASDSIPQNSVILDLRGWPADTGCHAADVDNLSIENKSLQIRISNLEKEQP